jgi:GDP-4-dehydro-6-deoxy-D-mannose reductase
VVRVRPFNHVGPGQSPGFVVPALAARIAEAARAGTPTIPVGNLGARRDLTDVRDIVRAYRMLMVSGTPGEVYNVCSGRDVSIAEVAERLLRLAGAELALVPDRELMRPVDVPVVRGDATRLHKATGWEPAYDLDTTLRDVLDQWRERVA